MGYKFFRHLPGRRGKTMKNPGADRMGKVSIHGMSQLHESVPHSEWMTAYSEIIHMPD